MVRSWYVMVGVFVAAVGGCQCAPPTTPGVEGGNSGAQMTSDGGNGGQTGDGGQGGSSGMMTSGGVVTLCGAQGQGCCVGNLCTTAATACVNGQCTGCGAANEACCPGQECLEAGD